MMDFNVQESMRKVKFYENAELEPLIPGYEIKWRNTLNITEQVNIEEINSQICEFLGSRTRIDIDYEQT